MGKQAKQQPDKRDIGIVSRLWKGGERSQAIEYAKARNLPKEAWPKGMEAHAKEMVRGR